jgi:hypothetical protein
MKYLFESTDEQRRIPLSKASWEKIEPKIKPDAPKWEWQKDTVDLPNDFMSSSRIKGHDQFERWYQKFVEQWGIDGELVEARPTFWKLEGNSKWDEASERGSDSVSKFYGDNRGIGNYTGD